MLEASLEPDRGTDTQSAQHGDRGANPQPWALRILSGGPGLKGSTFRADSKLTHKEVAMLVLTRKAGEAIVIGRDIEVTVLEVQGHRVRLGFTGPPEVPIHRTEIHERIAHPPALDHAECA
jgi:carbon storage regulator